ncbi:acid phosphatase [Alicyclobacillus curvatus]|nr:acid phosphatase [Alicyclobacillus curvatus]
MKMVVRTVTKARQVKLAVAVLLTVGLTTGCGVGGARDQTGETTRNQGQVTSNSAEQGIANQTGNQAGSLANRTWGITPSHGGGTLLGIAPPNHVVLVIEENHSYQEIAGNKDASYINSLMKQGANLTDYHGVEHPSQPNYLDLFSGSNQGVTNDSCPHTFSTPNLASELNAAKFSFTGYAEDLPNRGYMGCSNGIALISGTYARKHSPWVNFTNVARDANQPFSAFPKDYNRLPTVSIVIPNLRHDMHSGSIKSGDNWLRANLASYVTWAMQHNSLLIVTFDEDDKSESNRIPTVLVGPMIKPGNYQQDINHFSLLRTLEDLYHLPYLGQSAQASPIGNVWAS